MSASPLEVAEDLLTRADGDAGYRAAASRAYFAAFQHVLDHPRLADFPKTQGGEIHRLLIDHLKTHSDPALKRLGLSYLARLRALRNRADYDRAIRFERAMAQEALERATEIITTFLP